MTFWWRPEISNTLGVNEHNVLFISDNQPNDEIGVEIPGFEEADPSTLAQITKKVHLPLREESRVAIVKVPDFGRARRNAVEPDISFGVTTGDRCLR